MYIYIYYRFSQIEIFFKRVNIRDVPASLTIAIVKNETIESLIYAYNFRTKIVWLKISRFPPVSP